MQQLKEVNIQAFREHFSMKTIITAKTPAKIPYMENPPVEGGEIKYLTPEEFQQKFNCTYTEDIVTNQVQFESATKNDFKDARANAAYVRLQHPLESLVICKMSNNLGHGLFTTENIPRGTVICIYAGEYDPHTEEFVYSYGGINAAKIGGLARFMQHQPISKENHEAYLMQGLQDYRLFALQENVPEEQAKAMLSNPMFVAKKTKEYRNKISENDLFTGYDFKLFHFTDKNLANQIAQSNLSIESTKVAGVDVLLIVAMRDINKNESLGFSYGVMYWQHPSISHPPLLFTKVGQVIPPKNNYSYGKKPIDYNYDSSEEYSSNSDSDGSDDQDIASVHRNSDSQLLKLLEQMKQIQPLDNADSFSRNQALSPNEKSPKEVSCGHSSLSTIEKLWK